MICQLIVMSYMYIYNLIYIYTHIFHIRIPLYQYIMVWYMSLDSESVSNKFQTQVEKKISFLVYNFKLKTKIGGCILEKRKKMIYELSH